MFDFGFGVFTVETTVNLKGDRTTFFMFLDAERRKWTFVQRDGEALLCSIAEDERWEGWHDIFFTDAAYPGCEIKRERAEGTIGYTTSGLGLRDPKLKFSSFVRF